MKIISVVLAACVIFSQMTWAQTQPTAGHPLRVEDLKAMYPGARFVEVSQAEFNMLVATAGQNATLLIEPAATTNTVTDAALPAAPPEEHRPYVVPPREGTIEPARARVRTGGCFFPYIDLSVFAEGVGSIATDDLAIILFVVTGVFVVASALIYGGVIFYELLATPDQVTRWGELGLSAWHFGGSGRRGGMYGGRATFGLLGDFNRVGLVFEGGYLDGRFRLRDEDRFLNVTGAYGLLGPSVQWPLSDGPNPVSFDFEILTGYSNANQAGLISRALAGFSWGMGPTWRMGIMAGSTYAKIRESQGTLTTKSDFNLTGGLHMGARF